MKKIGLTGIIGSGKTTAALYFKGLGVPVFIADDCAKELMENDYNLKKSSEFSKFLKNIEVIEKDLISVFEKNNIKRIDCINKKFDPNFHQAMLEIEDESNEPGTVLQEIQPGYKLGERLLRPSFVGVSKKRAEKSEKKED